MKKLIGILFISVISCAAIARSGETDPKSIIKKDTAAQQESLGSMGFKNLLSNDIYTAGQPGTTQINPMAVSFVEDYMAKHGKDLEEMKVWGDPYFRMMDLILINYGIPKEMKYLAVIESHLRSGVKSWAGAVGPWQFMPETGRRMGLHINRRIDERKNYNRSTQAAAKYLQELYGQLGDWLLVIAAYNSGPGRVFSAMRRSGSKNFWELQYYLPEESRNHVKKFIGTHYYMEGCGGQTTATADEWNQFQINAIGQPTALNCKLSCEELANTETVNVQGKYNSVVIANFITMNINEFNTLNSGFDKLVLVEGGCDLRLPKDKMPLFKENKFIILRQSLMATLNSAGSLSKGFPAETKAKK